MAINFPNNPQNGTTYTHNGKTWTYNGESWVSTPPSETDTLDSVVSRGNTTTTTAVIPFLYSDQSAFPDASTYHGSVAHSDTDGAMYFSHNGSWVKLSNFSDIQWTTSGSDIYYNTGNVGIGTNQPSDLLDVQANDPTAYSASGSNPIIQVGNINTSANTNFSSIQMFTDGNSRGLVNLNALSNSTANSADFSIQTRHNATIAERMRITSDGKVGIGTSAPSDKLHVYSNTGGDHILIDGTSGINRGLKFASAGSDRWLFYADGDTESGSNVGSDLKIARYSDTGSYLDVAMKIERSTGRVGIGTNDPYKKLEVAGDLQLDADNASLYLKSGTVGTTGKVYWTYNSDADIYGSLGLDYDTRETLGMHLDSAYPITLDCSINKYIDFSVNGTAKMRMDSNGNFGIGTSIPSEKLEVDGAIKIGTTATSVLSGGEIKYELGDFYGHNGTEWKSLTSGGSGGTQWTTSASDIYYNTGNVGIGTSSPQGTLNIKGLSASLVLSDGDTAADVAAKLSVDGGRGKLELFRNGASYKTTLWDSGAKSFLENTAGADLVLQSSGGNVGIGTSSPGAKLEVETPSGAGNTNLFRLIRDGGYGDTTFNQWYTEGAGTPSGSNPTALYGLNMGLVVSSANNGKVAMRFESQGGTNTIDDSIIFRTSNSDQVVIDSGGNLTVSGNVISSTPTLSTHATNKGFVETEITVSSPIGLSGQITFIETDSTRVRENGWLITNGRFVNNTDELNSALANSVSNVDVFDTWGRFSHNNTDNQPANSTEVNAWTYDESTDTVICTINSSTHIGFYSTEVVDDYLLDVKLTSTAADDDRLGVLIAFAIDDNGREHTLTAIRNNESSLTWVIYYNYMRSDARVVADKSSFISKGSTWNTYSEGTRIKIRRNKDNIQAWTTQNNSSSFVSDSELSFSLTDNVDLEIFRGPKSYGYSCQSQQSATFSDIKFTAYGSNSIDNYVFDLTNDDVYVPDGNGGYDLDSTKSIESEIGKGRIIRDNVSGKLWNINSTGDVDDLLSYSNSDVNTLLKTSPISPTLNHVLSWGSGGYTWVAQSGGSGGSLSSRTTVDTSNMNVTSGSKILVAGASATGSISGYKSYSLFKVSINHPDLWVTIYTDSSSMSSDSSRLYTQDPSPGSGVIAEFISNSSNQDIIVSPTTIGFNMDSTPSGNIYLKVVNIGSSNLSTDFDIELTILQLEA